MCAWWESANEATGEQPSEPILEWSWLRKQLFGCAPGKNFTSSHCCCVADQCAGLNVIHPERHSFITLKTSLILCRLLVSGKTAHKAFLTLTFKVISWSSVPALHVDLLPDSFLILDCAWFCDSLELSTAVLTLVPSTYRLKINPCSVDEWKPNWLAVWVYQCCLVVYMPSEF